MPEANVVEEREGHFVAMDGTIHIGIFVVVCIYIVCIGSIAIFSFLKNMYASQITGDEQGGYFLAGRSFGKTILFLTMFSTLFSGFTVVYVPLECAWAGYRRVGRWFACAGCISCCNPLLVPAFRTIGVERNHTTLTEYYCDRYRSVSLAVLYTLTISFGAVPYVVAQFVALNGTVTALTKSVDIGVAATIAFAYYIFSCELIGGMRGVALTDAFQSAVMIIMYIIAPLVVYYWFGSLAEHTMPGCLNGQPGQNDYALQHSFCDNEQCNANGCRDSCTEELFACTTGANLDKIFPGSLADTTELEAGCGSTANSTGHAHPNFDIGAPLKCTNETYGARGTWVENGGGCPGCLADMRGGILVRYPTVGTGDYQCWKQFCMPLSILILSPQNQYFSRFMAAKSDRQLQMGFLPLCFAPFLLFTCGMYFGSVYMANHGMEFVAGGGLMSSFGGLMDDFIDLGGFPELIAVVMMCAAIAAFMSTSDSMVISFSSVIAVDLYQNFAWNQFRWGSEDGSIMLGGTTLSLAKQTIYVSKFVSFFTITFALFWAFDDTANSLNDLFDLSLGVVAIGGPGAFLSFLDFFGTGTRATGLSLTLGAGLALILNFGILRPQKGAAITCGKDDLCTCDETSTWNNNCKPWDLYLTNDMVAALVSWVFSVIFTWLIPSTVADLTEEKPRPKWLAWDNPNPELLKKFGDRMLTYDVASTICNKRNIPTNNNGWILCLVAWCISVLSIPWEGGWGGDTNADGVYTPPMPASYWFGFPNYIIRQFLFNLIAAIIGFYVMLTCWDAPDTDISGIPPLKKLAQSMTVDDVSEWLDDLSKNTDIRNYSDTFSKHEIDGNSLILMRAEDIQTMGVETIGDSLKLQRSIARLRVEGWLGEAIPYQSLISGADFDGSAPTAKPKPKPKPKKSANRRDMDIMEADEVDNPTFDVES